MSEPPESKSENDATNITGSKAIPSTSSGPDVREKGPQGRYVKLDDRLGSGAYKDVWRAYDTNEGREVAWNVVKLNRIPPNERKRIKTEVKLLRDIEHKNVIKYYNSWVDRDKEQIVFITEIMSHGSLKDYLRKNPIIRWNAVKRWCRQILRGLEFLHGKQIIHRDIKCDNIFVNGATGDVRIGDLGLSTRISEERALQNGLPAEDKNRPMTAAMTCLGTPEFMAPELYEENYNEKVDIYAFGMMILEMVTGLMPYHECTSTAQIYRKVLNGVLPPELNILEKLNHRCCELVRSCLLHQSKRPTATEILANEFLLPNDQEDFLEVRVKLSHEDGMSDAYGRPRKNSLSDDDEDEHGIEEERTNSSSTATETYQHITEKSTSLTESGVKPQSQKLHIEARDEGPTHQNSSKDNNSPNNLVVEMLEADSKKESIKASIDIVRESSTLLDHVARDSSVIESKVETPQKISKNGTSTSHHVKPSMDDTFNIGGFVPTQSLVSNESEALHRTTESASFEIRKGSSSRVKSRLIQVSGQTPFKQEDSFHLDNSIRSYTSTISDIMSQNEKLSREQDKLHVLNHANRMIDIPISEDRSIISPIINSPDNLTGQNHTFFQSAEVYVMNIAVSDHLNDGSTGTNSSPVFSVIKIHLRVSAKKEAKDIDVEFEFDLTHDDTKSVAIEMRECEDLVMIEVETDVIVDVIDPVVETAKKWCLGAKRDLNEPIDPILLSDTIIQDILSSSIYGRKSCFKILRNRLRYSRPRTNQQQAQIVVSSNTSDESNHNITVGRSMSSNDALTTDGFNNNRGNHNNSSKASRAASPLLASKSVAYQNNLTTGSRPRAGTEVLLDDSSEDEDNRVLLVDIDDGLDEQDPEYLELETKAQEVISKLEKDALQRLNNLSMQRDKAEETYKKESEKLVSRIDDLNKQLESMMEKFRERMDEFAAKKKQIEEKFRSSSKEVPSFDQYDSVSRVQSPQLLTLVPMTSATIINTTTLDSNKVQVVLNKFQSPEVSEQKTIDPLTASSSSSSNLQNKDVNKINRIQNIQNNMVPNEHISSSDSHKVNGHVGCVINNEVKKSKS